MFVRSAVSGVRSSWLASITSRCCCSRDVRSAASIVLKLAASRPSSSCRSTVDRLVEVLGLRDLLGRASVSCSIGRTMRRAMSHASDGRDERAGQRDEQQADVERRQHVVRRPRCCARSARRRRRAAATVSTRYGVAVDRDGAEARRAAVLRRCAGRARRPGARAGPRSSATTVPVGVEQLRRSRRVRRAAGRGRSPVAVGGPGPPVGRVARLDARDRVDALQQEAVGLGAQLVAARSRARRTRSRRRRPRTSSRRRAVSRRRRLMPLAACSRRRGPCG